jgi:hypothetical protein
MSSLQQIKADATSFVCGDKTYTIDKTLSFNRFEKLKEFSLEFGYSADVKSIMVGLRKAWDFVNSTKFADAAVQLHNLMTSVVNLEQKRDVQFRIAALFINEKNEDTTVYDEGIMNAKIENWSKHLDAAFFFTFAVGIVPSFIPVYKVVTRDFSLRDEIIQKITSSTQTSQNNDDIGVS